MYATHNMYHSAQNMRRVVHIEDIKTWGFRDVGPFIEKLEKEGEGIFIFLACMFFN